MSAKTFFRNKLAFKDNEQEALAAVLAKENLIASQLTPNHSEKQFRWNLNQQSAASEASSEFPFGLHLV